MKTIIIEKLFGEHDVRIDLDRKLNIIIGENGIGKTTILNMLYIIYQQDFITLTKYSFDSIQLITENDTMEIRQGDLYPKLEVLLKDIGGRVNNYEANMVNAFAELSIGLNNGLKEKESIYYEFLSATYNNKPLNNKIKESLDRACFSKFTESFDPQAEIHKALISLEHHKSGYSSDISNYFLHSKISETIRKNTDFKKHFKEFFDFLILSLNMVDKYKIIDDISTKPYIYSNILIWLNQYDDVSLVNRMDEDTGDFLDKILNKIAYSSQENLIGLPLSSPPKYTEEYISILKKAYKSPEYNYFNEGEDITRFIEELEKKEAIEVNKVINRFAFTEEYMKKINNKAIDYFYESIGKPYDINNDLIYAYGEFNENERMNIKNYIKPLLMRESIFGEAINQILNPAIETNMEISQILKDFRKFFDENIKEIINSFNPNIKKFENLLNKFITSKIFYATPSGLKVLLKKYKEYEHGKFKVIENDINEIKLADLSSGEKKLIIMLLFSCIFDNFLILIDEPEISLSINLQEKILRVLMDIDNNNSYLVATHSSFIVSDDELAESIVPLPLEE